MVRAQLAQLRLFHGAVSQTGDRAPLVEAEPDGRFSGLGTSPLRMMQVSLKVSNEK
jgi:hypothetical protein